MGKIEHLDILDLGVEIWNKWRKDNPDLRPDLSDSDLSNMELPCIDLSYSNLTRVNFSHTNLDGDGPSERANRYGYDTHKELGGGWYTEGIGENIGKMPTGNVEGRGYVANDPDSIAKAQVDSWMNSQGHRENLLDPEYDRIGIGVAYDGLYYISTQDFW